MPLQTTAPCHRRQPRSEPTTLTNGAAPTDENPQQLSFRHVNGALAHPDRVDRVSHRLNASRRRHDYWLTDCCISMIGIVLNWVRYSRMAGPAGGTP